MGIIDEGVRARIVQKDRTAFCLDSATALHQWDIVCGSACITDYSYTLATS